MDREIDRTVWRCFVENNQIPTIYVCEGTEQVEKGKTWPLDLSVNTGVGKQFLTPQCAWKSLQGIKMYYSILGFYWWLCGWYLCKRVPEVDGFCRSKMHGYFRGRKREVGKHLWKSKPFGTGILENAVSELSAYLRSILPDIYEFMKGIDYLNFIADLSGAGNVWEAVYIVFGRT